MSLSRPVFAVAALALALLLAGCGLGAGPHPSGSAAPTATASGAPDPTVSGVPGEEDPEAREAALVTITSGAIIVSDAHGGPLAEGSYDSDAAAVAEALADALGADPAITTTAGNDGGCAADQTMYDFGGFLLRSPGNVGAIGAFEIEVTAASTGGGVPVELLLGGRVGQSRADLAAHVGEVVDLFSYESASWVGFDILDGAASEEEQVGAIGRIEGGVLTQANYRHYLYGDC